MLKFGEDDKEIFNNIYSQDDTEKKARLIATAKAIKTVYNPKTLLDIGCATGHLVVGCKDLGIEAFGVNSSHFPSLKAEKDIKNNIFVADMDKDMLPFSDEQFDFITIISTIQYIKNTQNLLTEINRTLKPSGCAFVGMYFKTQIKSLAEYYHVFTENNLEAVFNLYKFKKVDECDLMSNYIAYMIEQNQDNGIRTELGKLLCDSGKAGRKTVYYIDRLINRKVYSVCGNALFIKEDIK